MTDYRDLNHPGLHPSRADAYRTANQSSTSIGGILIGLALIGLVFLSLSLFFGGSSDQNAGAPPAAVDQSSTTTTPAVPAPATTPTTD